MRWNQHSILIEWEEMEKGRFWWLLHCPLECGLRKSLTSLLFLQPSSTQVNQPGPPYRLAWVLCAGHCLCLACFPHPHRYLLHKLLPFHQVSAPVLPSLLHQTPCHIVLTMSHTFPCYCIHPPHLTLPSFCFFVALVIWCLYVRSIAGLCLTLVTPGL